MKEYSELALESAEAAGRAQEIREKRLSSHLRLLRFDVAAEEGGGRFLTLLTEENLLEGNVERELCDGVAECLRSLIKKRKGKVLAVGLGNPDAVVDALGAETVKRLSAGQRGGGYLATLTPSVFGLTGMETASVVKGVVREYSPDLVLCVDTLATRRAERLSRAVQIGRGGIVPGGGVGNRREALSEQSLTVPVITVGVPLLAHADRCSSLPAGLVVTPKEIDLFVPAFSRVIAEGVERALFE